MNNFESYSEMYNAAQNVPLTAQRVYDYISFICHYITTQDKIIEHLMAESKDITTQMYYRDRALYVLGLGEKPTPPWLQDKTI